MEHESECGFKMVEYSKTCSNILTLQIFGGVQSLQELNDQRHS